MPPHVVENTDATADRLVAIEKPIAQFKTAAEPAIRAEYSTAGIPEQVIIADFIPISSESYDPTEAPKQLAIPEAMQLEVQLWEAAGLEGWTTDLKGGDSAGHAEGNAR